MIIWKGKSFFQIIRKCANGLSTFLFAMIILNFVFASKRSDKQLLSHFATMVVAILLFAIVLGIHKRLRRVKLAKRHRHNPWLVLTMTLYGAMLYIFANIYYKSGSDLWTVDYTARILVNSEPYIDWCGSYYSMYPNNIMLTVLYSLGLRINTLFGILDSDNSLFIFVAENCLISCITMVLVAKILYRLTNDSFTAGVGTVISVCYFCLNPYNVWPYSDPFSLWIPVSIVAIFVLIDNPYIKCGLLTALSIFSFQIKPQNSIPVIALVCVAFVLIDKLAQREYQRANIVKCLCSIFVCGIITLYGVNIVEDYFCSKIPVDETKALPFTHWTMMGLNRDARGGWSEDDVHFSSSIEDPKERTRATIDVAKERLSEMGVIGYLEFLWIKLNKLCNNGVLDYSSSTGDWYDVVYPAKNEFAAPLLRSFFYYDGDHYPIYYTAMNILWAFLIIICLMASIVNFRENDPIQFWLGISILELFLFELLFEAQARHLYSSIPLFVLYGTFGMYRIFASGNRCAN